MAFLRLKEPLPEGVRPLPLGSSQGTGDHAFQTFGFPSASPEEGIWGDGHILAETLMQGMRVLQLSSPQITPGFSGAPVFDTVNRRVVGMVTAIASQDGYGRMAETAFITPVETLRMICPQLVALGCAALPRPRRLRRIGCRVLLRAKAGGGEALASLESGAQVPGGFGPFGKRQILCRPGGPDSAVAAGRRAGKRLLGDHHRPAGREAAGELGGQRPGRGGQGLAEAARSWLAKNPEKTRLMLVIDQFEELFATASPGEAADFLGQLQELLQSDLPITLLLIMRDDFFSRFAREAPPSLFEWVQRGFVHISAGLDERELEEIIEGPAERSVCSLRRGWRRLWSGMCWREESGPGEAPFCPCWSSP